MKAPMTSNSITDRVVYTGLYMSETAPEAKRKEDSRTVHAPSVSPVAKTAALKA